MKCHDLTGKGNPPRSSGRLYNARTDFDILAKTIIKAGYGDIVKRFTPEKWPRARAIEKLTAKMKEAFTDALLQE